MDTLETLRAFDFAGYDHNKVDTTRGNIADLQSDVKKVFELWTQSGLQWQNKFDVDFEFYTSDQNSATLFSELLVANGYDVVLKSKRTLLIFKGWEIQASYLDYWNVQKIKDTIEQLGLIARKYNILIEGFGGFVKK